MQLCHRLQLEIYLNWFLSYLSVLLVDLCSLDLCISRILLGGWEACQPQPLSVPQNRGRAQRCAFVRREFSFLRILGEIITLIKWSSRLPNHFQWGRKVSQNLSSPSWTSFAFLCREHPLWRGEEDSLGRASFTVLVSASRLGSACSCEIIISSRAVGNFTFPQQESRNWSVGVNLRQLIVGTHKLYLVNNSLRCRKSAYEDEMSFITHRV